ncbi:ABC transporter substrate-binding protein [Bordetella sp. N]|uniref:ABC transporter substrate-binding protein n=1 Tax=Bordetella sp. N TaxID=1746199 RepID=UPI00070D3574|nr:ABC transporter substrate-binding protein [Bordetella sp. N]ALM82758.1 peptide ABC transporter substrate-binding protein [Bordetella sp. N]
MNRRTFLLTPLAMAVAQTLPVSAFAQPKPRNLKWVPQADLALLDPIFTTAQVTQNHAQLVFDTLYGLDEKLEPHPQMAEGHTVSDDKLIWTIKLRDGLKFHDDTPVRAADVVASIKRWGDRDLMGHSLMNVTKSIEVVDDRTLRITLTETFPLILHALGRQTTNMAAIMPERLAKAPSNQAIKEMVGSGPFRFVASKWISGSKVVYERFEGYVPRQADTPASFGASPKVAHVPGVEWNIIPDAATAIAALQAGEVDGVERINNDFLGMLKEMPDIHLVKIALPGINIMRFNQLFPPFNNADIRRAVLSVVNQTEYMTAANGSSFPEYWNDKCGVFVPGCPMDSRAGMEKLTGKRDIAAAKAAIKKAGYNNERVVLLDPVDFPSHHASALVTADLFKKLGFNVDLQAVDWGTAVQRRNSQASPQEGGWSVAFTGLSGMNNLDPAGHLALRGNGKAAWFGWPDSPKLEELRNQWFKAPDVETQKKICAQIQEQVFIDVPYIPLGATYQVSAVRKQWKNFEPYMPIFYNLRPV